MFAPLETDLAWWNGPTAIVSFYTPRHGDAWSIRFGQSNAAVGPFGYLIFALPQTGNMYAAFVLAAAKGLCLLWNRSSPCCGEAD